MFVCSRRPIVARLRATFIRESMEKIARFWFNKPNQAVMAIANGSVTILSIDVKGQETESAAIT
jgi:hypothetical protein